MYGSSATSAHRYFMLMAKAVISTHYDNGASDAVLEIYYS
jgi:hypothetical protein